MNRTALIEERLSSHFGDIGAIPVPTSAEDWARLDIDPEYSRRVLGVTSPAPIQGVGWTCRFSPEIINRATSHFPDELFDHAMTAIEYLLDAEVEHFKLPAADRIAAADRALLQIADVSLRLVTEAQFAAQEFAELDADIASFE